MIKIKNKIGSYIYNVVYYVCNFYRLTAYKNSDETWFSIAVSRTEFKNRPYLQYASYSHYLKLSRIVKVIDEIEDWTKTHGLEPDKVNILDVGCGWAAVYARCLASLGYTVTGIDLDKGSVFSAKDLTKGFSNIKILQGDAIKYLKINDKAYDIVLALDTLEHIEEPDEFCNKIYNHIPSPGLFVVIIPDGYSEIESIYLPVVKFISKKFLKLDYGPGETHIQKFSLKRIGKILRDSGFSYKFCKGIFSTRIPLIFCFIFGFRSWPAYINIKMAERLPKIMSNSWLVVGHKE